MSPTLRFGLTLGGLLSAWPLVLFALGLDREPSLQTVSTFVNLIIISSVMYVALKRRRDVEGNGFMSVGQAFGHAFRISAIASLISATFSYLYFTLVNPEIVDWMKLKQEEEMIARGASDAEVEQAMKIMETWMSPGFMVVMGILVILILCLVIALILAAFLKKVDPSAEIS